MRAAAGLAAVRSIARKSRRVGITFALVMDRKVAELGKARVNPGSVRMYLAESAARRQGKDTSVASGLASWTGCRRWGALHRGAISLPFSSPASGRGCE